MRKHKKPWPTKDAMDQIYEKHLWGGAEFKFYSGEGSHKPELVEPYLEVLAKFLSSFNKLIKVADLGCGDFNIGKNLVKYTSEYHAIDVVDKLIDHNRETYQEESLKFYSLDIAEDELPPADCVILRQVLQHLSNAEVQKVLDKVRAYKYLVLTEHLPVGDFTPNKDIISGQGIRIKKQSGLNLLLPPFNFKVKGAIELLSLNLEDGKGKLLTTLFEVF